MPGLGCTARPSADGEPTSVACELRSRHPRAHRCRRIPCSRRATEQRVPRVVAQRRLTMPVRRSPFEQLSDHRSAVPLPADANGRSSVRRSTSSRRLDRCPTSRSRRPHLRPNGERAPWGVPVGAQSQVVGHGRYEALLRLLHLKRRACSPVVCVDVVKDHRTRLVRDGRGDLGAIIRPRGWPSAG